MAFTPSYRASATFRDTGNANDRETAKSEVDEATAGALLAAEMQLKGGNNTLSASGTTSLDPANFPVGHPGGASQTAVIELIDLSSGKTKNLTFRDVSTSYIVAGTNKLNTTHPDLVAFLAAYNAAHPAVTWSFDQAHYVS